MAIDARIAVGLPTHPKTKKLIKRLGQAAAWNLICLILWAAANRSDGDLAGMSDEDIELAADWLGEEGALVGALVEVRYLDRVDDGYQLHDWQEHNPWVAGADLRSAKARWNAAKRHHGTAEADRLVPEYAAIRHADSNAAKRPTGTGSTDSVADVVAGSSATETYDDASSNASSTPVADAQHGDSNAPSPSPSPSPSPTNVCVSREVAVCTVMRSAGMQSVNASNPLLAELLAAGADFSQFSAAAKDAVEKGKGFAYALAIVRGQLADAARMAADVRDVTSRRKPAKSASAPWSEADRQVMAGLAPGVARAAPTTVPQTIPAVEVHDVLAIAGG